jgi:hypothetical protein
VAPTGGTSAARDAVPSAGAPEVPLKPYDNVLIMRQPDWGCSAR